MKKVVITGENGYIGSNISKWLEQFSDEFYVVKKLDVRTDEWRQFDFSDIDVVIHTAAIVHSPDIKDINIYKRVNTDLSFEIAKVAKSAGVKQFVFFSTMAVYGLGKRLTINMITEETKENPHSAYGVSKYLAEKKIQSIEDSNFKIIIVRPPNVYGKNCKGGYISGFKAVVSKLPAIPYAFPNVKQSMIYIDNLCEFIRLALNKDVSGVFMPQDDIAVSAVELMKCISIGFGEKKKVSKCLGVGVYILSFLSIIKKAYGGIEYDKKMTSYFNNEYIVVPFKEGIKRTVK